MTINPTASPLEDFSYWEIKSEDNSEIKKNVTMINTIRISLIYSRQLILDECFKENDIQFDSKSKILCLNVGKFTPSFGPCVAVVGLTDRLVKIKQLQKESFIYERLSIEKKWNVVKFIIKNCSLEKKEESIKIGLRATVVKFEYFGNTNVLIIASGPNLLENGETEILQDIFPNNDVILLHEDPLRLPDFVTKQLLEMYSAKKIDFLDIENENVNHYIKIGTYLLSCEEIDNLKEEINNYNDLGDEFTIPFMFVCSSSGTGKTQLPFTLDVPLLYFLYYTKASDFEVSQDIYKPFINRSKEFFNCLNVDLINYSKTSKLQCGQNEKKYLDFNEIKQRYEFKYWIVGFLISFMKSVAQNKHDSSLKKHWIYYQLQPLHVIMKPMTILEGKEKLKEIKIQFKLENNFIIFIDECCVSEGEECKNRFRFLRNVIRNMDLLIVMMGTNANSADFVDGGSPRMSRSCDKFTWCHIMHQLPKTSTKWLLEEKSIFLEKYKKWLLDKKKEFLKNNNFLKAQMEFKDFVNLMIELCEKERPLIASLILKSLFTLEMDAIVEPKIAIKKCFLYILEYMYKEFRDYKQDEKNVFLSGQFAMISSTFWDPKHRIFKELTLTSSLVNKHVAYLHVDKEMKTNFLNILIKDSTLMYKKGGEYYPFVPRSTFPSFESEPLTLMALSLATTSCFIFPIFNSDESQVVTSEGMSVSRISTIDAFKEIKSKRTPFYTQMSTAMDGFALELLFNAACIAASHEGGFNNLSFTNWISNLIHELSVNATVIEENKWKDGFDKTFWDIIKIPYCLFGSTEDKIVNNKVKTFLKETFGCDLAVASCHLGSESRDFYIRQLDENKSSIVSAECKCHKKGVDFSIISKIVGKITTFKFDVFIIFANQFRKFRIGSIKKYSGPNSLYKLIKANGKYSIDLIRKIDTENSPIVLIDLETINGNNDYAFLLK